jgi:16S rRNA (cytidine1402-2'-O)-methyltransferase
MLYLVATPIGNLEDLSPRAQRVLREVNAIGAEDTRHTLKLLAHFDIHTPLFSFHQHNEKQRIEEIVARLKNGEHIAIVSDAGMPLISDAGFLLVERLQSEKLEHTCIPGSSAVETALVLSGLPTDTFQFLGFMPREKKDAAKARKNALESLITTVFFESPQRLVDTLREFALQSPDRTVAVARELTKIHEEVVKGSAQEVLAHFETAGVKGECVLLISPAASTDQPALPLSGSISEMVTRVQEIGNVPRSTAAKIVAAVTGLPKREVYDASLEKGGVE